MSDSLHINPADGPHAAAGLTDHQVEYMCKLMLWELSVRRSEGAFMDYLDEMRTLREQNADVVEQAQYERDVLNFEESVLADLDALPSTEDRIVI